MIYKFISFQTIPEVPRNQLRVVEKLGEGVFGMVSSY